MFFSEPYDTHAVVDGSELIFQCVSVTEGYNCHNVIGCWTTKNSCYSEFLQGCSDCMGCISLRRKQHCVLNKQYSKEEYEKIKQSIRDQMGDRFGSSFPPWLAPFTYQDSAYRDYGSLSSEEIEKMGWTCGHEQKKELFTGEMHEVSELPDKTSEFIPELLNKIYRCPITDRPFKIIPQELALLKKIKAPLPRRHFDQRFRDRVRFRK